MNNIELEQLKRDIQEFYGDGMLMRLQTMSEKRLQKLKKDLNKLKNQKLKSNKDQFNRKQIEKKISELESLTTTKVDDKLDFSVDTRTITTQGEKRSVSQSASSETPEKKITSPPVPEIKYIPVPANRKPKILLITDVKKWAWWLKGEYIIEYLSDEFDIDMTCVIGPGCVNQYNIPQNKYDLYFTFGYSYIDFLYNVPKFKKATGVTAHRPPNMIKPKMMQAGHLHANSLLLFKSLVKMGFSNVHYVPNGVNTDLFRPVKPIPPERTRIVCGHVGKECPAKGQKDIIYPAIQKAGAQRITSVVTWKEKIPHDQMYKIYQDMDVFIVASLEDGTPNPALEAAACGRPIISNNIGNMPELIHDGVNGFIVDRNVDAYVEKIKLLQEDRELLIRMGQNSRKIIEEEWTWKLQAENYRNMFRKIFIVKED